MQTRTLGSTDAKVSPIMLGGNVFGWTADEATSFAILDAFVDRGLSLSAAADLKLTGDQLEQLSTASAY